MDKMFAAIGLYLLAGTLSAVWMTQFLRRPIHRPPVGLRALAFVTFTLLWPVIAACAAWYGVTCLYRMQTGKPKIMPQSRHWAERDAADFA